MSLDLTLKNREFNFKVTNSGQHRVYEFDDFRLDATIRLLYRSGEQIILTPKAVETLVALVQGHGTVISKEELIQKIWPDTIVEESNLAQYLHVLRKTLGETSEGKPYIETLKRRGYRFNGTVRALHETNAIPAPDSDFGKFGAGFQNVPPKVANSFTRRFERHGNVLAVADWTETDEKVDIVDRDATATLDTSFPLVQPTRSRSFLPLFAVVLVAVLAGIIFGIYKFTPGRNPDEVGRNIPFLGSDMTRLTTTGSSKRGAAISPDGKYVAHIISASDGESLWVRQVAVANDTRIAGPSPSAFFVWVTFEPDGNYVYYLTLERDRGQPELFRVPVLGGPIVKVLHDIAPPTFSPDGTRLAFMKTVDNQSRLMVANADGTDETVLVTRTDPDYLNMFWYAPAWSLDGKSIAFPVNQSDEKGRYETVLAVDVETRVERKLTDARWEQVGQPRWLEDGLMVTAAETSTGPQQLWHISVPDGAVSRITRDLNNYENLSLTSDAKTLAVIQNNVVSNIWIAGENAVGSKQILSEAGWLNELIWLPDGRLAYTSNAGGSSEIWTMNADGTNIRQLTVGANARLGLAVTADEKQLVFAAERDGKYNLWRIDIAGSNLERITNGEGEFYPQCTPDGRWIVYQSGGNNPTLWKIPIGGGEATLITKTKASRPSISPDGKFVAYHYLSSIGEGSRWGFGISSLEDGKLVKRFDFPSTVTERLVKWTRDGKSIAFLNSPGGIPNIWLQPVDGGAAKPLTDFSSDSIIAFNWKADGSGLAVIRGAETSDVLLINRSASK
ncbi:hypothetical protein BH10ACI3_BH10ACI3_28670 [soil metagenome]